MTQFQPYQGIIDPLNCQVGKNNHKPTQYQVGEYDEKSTVRTEQRMEAKFLSHIISVLPSAKNNKQVEA